MEFPHFPIDLIQGFKPVGGEGVVAFVGSGPSCDAGVPNWSDLIQRVAVDVGLDSEISESVRTGRLIDAAQFLSRERSEEEIQERVASEIQTISRAGQIHEHIVSAPFSGIVTTNYDLLLSVSDHEKKFDFPITHKSIIVRKHLHRPFMLHLHGHVNEPRTIVLSRSGYDEVFAPEGSKVRHFLHSVLSRYTVLFIGFGFRDPNVDAILRESAELNAISETSVFGLVPSGPEIDRVLDNKLKHRKINPIYIEECGDHGKSALCEWLTKLIEVVDKIAQSRRAPVRAVKPVELLRRIELMLQSPDWKPFLTKVIVEMNNRPDLKNLARKGMTDGDLGRLFDMISVGETRSILMALNRHRRSDVIEDALACFPPQPP